MEKEINCQNDENKLEKFDFNLTSPTQDDKDAYLAELRKSFELSGKPLTDVELEQEWVKLCEGLLRDSLSGRQNEFWCMEEGKYLGRIQYRKKLTDAMRIKGGNIGYEVASSARGKGVASFMVKQITEIAKNDGLVELLVTCDSDNLPSIGVIEKANGKYIDTVTDENGVEINRYKIAL